MAEQNLSVFIASLLTPFLVFSTAAAQVKSSASLYETALVLPWSFVEKMINPIADKKTAEYQYPMQNIAMTAQGVPFVVPQAKLSVQLHLKDVVSQGASTVWETDQLALQLDVAGFEIQKDIQEQRGGVIVVGHLQAQCAPFSLNQVQAHSKMNWLWTVVDRKVSATLSSLELDWPANSWQIGPIQCTGPIGFADLVQAELQNQLAQSSAFLPLIQKTLQDSLNQQMNAQLSPWSAPQWLKSDKSMSLQLLGSGVVNDKGLLFRTLLRLGEQTSPADLTKMLPLGLSDDLLAKVGALPTVIFSKAALQDLIKHQDLFPQVQTNLNQIEAFHDLLGSRFIQLFVWPDLWSFSSQTSFQMTTKLASSPKLIFSEKNYIWMDGNLSSNIQAPRSGYTWDYVQLQTRVQSWLQYSVSGGMINLQLVQPRFDMTTKFGSDYVKYFHPLNYISTSILKKSLEQSAVLKQQSRFSLPQIQLSEAMILKAQGLSRPNDNYFFMQWSN